MILSPLRAVQSYHLGRSIRVAPPLGAFFESRCSAEKEESHQGTARQSADSVAVAARVGNAAVGRCDKRGLHGAGDHSGDCG